MIGKKRFTLEPVLSLLPKTTIGLWAQVMITNVFRLILPIGIPEFRT